MEQPLFYNLRIPVATYRLQFNGNFRFTDAAAIIPYLAELGISDVYSSPYLAAYPGSPHGYDITDPTKINPEIGTEEEYNAFTDALKQHGMGLVLDIVPNHMCIDSANRYWMDLLENGPASSFSSFFDIDWDPVKKELRNKVLLPLLGDQYGIALEKKDIRLAFEEGAFFLLVYDNKLPILPETYADILSLNIEELEKVDTGSCSYDELMSIITSARRLPPYSDADRLMASERQREKEIIKKRLKEICRRDPQIRAFADRAVAAFNGQEGNSKSFDLLDNLLSRQVYRLSHWRVAAEEINYRRFFDVNSLAAIKMEDPEVFEETHRLIFRLIEEGRVTGLRVDHPDGLHDPWKYFDRLQRRCFAIALRSRLEEVRENVDLPYGETYVDSVIAKRYEQALEEQRYFKPFYIVAEKILGRGETMPAEWPLFSTTGYVFLNSLSGIFVDTRNAKAFDALYKRFTRAYADFQEVLYRNKKLVMQVAMSSEINTLGHSLSVIAEGNRHTRDFTLNSLIKVIVEVIACFPVYRTYINGPEVKERDRHYIDLAVSKAVRRNPVVNESIFLFLKGVLLLAHPPGTEDEVKAAWLDFTMRFQQITGPVMAKGVEDTSFYVYNRLVSLNEVGGAPDRFGTVLDTFHGQNIERIKNWPYALITSSTHDTKRGEDVRARINVLSEIPAEWGEHVHLWARLNRKKKTVVNRREVPDRNEEYLLYQTLLGTWPVGPVTEEEYGVYKERIKTYMVKAVKEAKVNTSWVNPDSMYEDALTVFIDAVLDRGREGPFLDDFVPFQKRVSLCGMYNSCGQALLKICSPGIPDFYQGTELWDLRLVDPDNRAPVDYTRRMEMFRKMKGDLEAKGPVGYVKELTGSMEDARMKMYITYRALTLRGQMREAFEKGDYIPLETSGIRSAHIIAFARRFLNTTIIVAVPRFLMKLLPLSGPDPGGMWKDTTVIVPGGPGESVYEDIFTGERMKASASDPFGLECSALFRYFPVALLRSGR